MSTFEKIRIDTAKATILCIDDDPDIIALLGQLMLRAGYSYEPCCGPEAALAAVTRRVPDLILADVDLNGEDGLELVRRLKQLPGVDEVPVLFMSGLDTPNIVRRAHDAGGMYYLSKPFDPEVLMELVAKSLWLPHVVNSHIAARFSRTTAN